MKYFHDIFLISKYFHHSPWRSLDLHAKKLTYKGAKRNFERENKDASNDEKLPPLNIPGLQDFSPDFTIVHDSSTSSKVKSRYIQWVEQCHGCGKELMNPSKTCCKEVMEYTAEEPNCDVGCSFYCAPKCACENGAPAWAEASATWQDLQGGSGYFLKSNYLTGFWGAVEQDEDSLKLMADAVWTPDCSSYHLFAPNDSDDEDSDY
jgi:hypothetical protein